MLIVVVRPLVIWNDLVRRNSPNERPDIISGGFAGKLDGGGGIPIRGQSLWFFTRTARCRFIITHCGVLRGSYSPALARSGRRRTGLPRTLQGLQWKAPLRRAVPWVGVLWLYCLTVRSGCLQEREVSGRMRWVHLDGVMSVCQRSGWVP